MKTRIQILEKQIKDIRHQINEVLASPYPFTVKPLKINAYGEGEIHATFETFSSEYLYVMSLKAATIGDDMVTVIGNVDFADDEGSVTITGKGDAFRVMATVVEITKQVVNDQSTVKRFLESTPHADIAESPYIVDMLTFTAFEQSRRRLYERIARTVPGYTIVKKEGVDYTLLADKVPAEKKRVLKDLLGG
jgi:hypothetical protein